MMAKVQSIKELNEALEDWTANKNNCIICGKLLKDHSKKDLDKCYDNMIDEEREAEKYEQ